MVSIKMLSKLYSAKLCAGAQQWPRLGSWGAPLTSTLEIRNLEKKPQNVEDKPLWPIPWRLEPWKINPGPRKNKANLENKPPNSYKTSPIDLLPRKSNQQILKAKHQTLTKIPKPWKQPLKSRGRSHEPGTVLKSIKAWKLGQTKKYDSNPWTFEPLKISIDKPMVSALKLSDFLQQMDKLLQRDSKSKATYGMQCLDS